jgi:predicted DNA-binding protein YlxM (UPF0122 family)
MSIQEEETMGNSVFIDLFGGSPINKVLDFLLDFYHYDYSMSDIAKYADVSYSTLKTLLPELEEKDFIKRTRISGKSKMYQFNKDNPYMKCFAKFDAEITNIGVQEFLAKEEKEEKVCLVKGHFKTASSRKAAAKR